ncbi:hypothetical protein Vadar_005813 [Vaccinium darrowii]|uniref:Uncharacterized protein n=1 Tax=Vaccinium darrowii TaxID=229202 RepID=A0ACB7ZAM1_9ERIC|nr:hypothetical protein Vadar_005813 [Vaccinium darrowii]
MENTHFQEPESNAPFNSATATNHHNNCTTCGGSIKKRSPSSTPSDLQEPISKKLSLRPSSSSTFDQPLTNGFTKVALPFALPITWASQSTPTLRRCVSDPVSSPGSSTDKNGDSSRVVTNPLSPEIAKIGGLASTPSPAKAGSSASATLPIFRRSFSDPSPKAYQEVVTPSDSVIGQMPNSKRVKRMRDGIRVMKQWLDEVMHEGKEDEFEDEEEDGGYVEHKNGTPKDHEPQAESEEAVSVETSGKKNFFYPKPLPSPSIRVSSYHLGGGYGGGLGEGVGGFGGGADTSVGGGYGGSSFDAGLGEWLWRWVF